MNVAPINVKLGFFFSFAAFQAWTVKKTDKMVPWLKSTLAIWYKSSSCTKY